MSCITIYAEKYDEEFADYFVPFLREVVVLLVATPRHTRFDSLVIGGLSFLAQAVLKQAHKATFAAPDFLRNMIQNVVYPNLAMHQTDLDEFEDNPEDFISRDIEGSDKFTRRKAASDLLRNMGRNFDAEVAGLTLMVVENLLKQFAANPTAQAAWVGKETAVQMYLATAVSGFTAAKGAANENLNPHVQSRVPVVRFFTQHVLPDMQAPAAPAVLKAAALKFLSIFRQQLASAGLVKALVPLLLSKSVVVHTYAANCLERVLVMRAPLAPGAAMGGGPSVPVVPVAALAPLAVPLLTNLFSIVNSGEPDNAHVMKAVMRVISSCESVVATDSKLVVQLTESLCLALRRLVKKSTSPQFNHYVFDSLAAIMRASCTAQPEMVRNFMTMLLPEFKPILADGDSDFYPYALQLLAQLLSFATPGAPLLPLFQGGWVVLWVGGGGGNGVASASAAVVTCGYVRVCVCVCVFVGGGVCHCRGRRRTLADPRMRRTASLAHSLQVCLALRLSQTKTPTKQV